jgi:hypothetical protein
MTGRIRSNDRAFAAGDREGRPPNSGYWAAIGRLLGGYWADRSVANNPMRADRPIAAPSRRSHTKRVPWRGMQGPQFWRAPSWRAGMMLMRAHEYARTGRDLPRGCSARQARQARHVACLAVIASVSRHVIARRQGSRIVRAKALPGCGRPSAPRTAPRTARVYIIIPTGTNGGRETHRQRARAPPPARALVHRSPLVALRDVCRV